MQLLVQWYEADSQKRLFSIFKSCSWVTLCYWLPNPKHTIHISDDSKGEDSRQSWSSSQVTYYIQLSTMSPSERQSVERSGGLQSRMLQVQSPGPKTRVRMAEHWNRELDGAPRYPKETGKLEIGREIKQQRKNDMLHKLAWELKVTQFYSWSKKAAENYQLCLVVFVPGFERYWAECDQRAPSLIYSPPGPHSYIPSYPHTYIQTYRQNDVYVCMC